MKFSFLFVRKFWKSNFQKAENGNGNGNRKAEIDILEIDIIY